MEAQMPGADLEIARLQDQIRYLRERTRRLERELEAARPLITAVRSARIWDFAPYDISPDPDWVAIDRQDVLNLQRALAGTDHWKPWNSIIERRGAV